MMRRRILTVSAGLLLLFLIARMPLSVAVGGAFIPSVPASGTLWSGVMDGVPLPGAPSARMTVRGQPLALFSLQYRADFETQTLLTSGTGQLILSPFAPPTIEGLTARIDMSAVKTPIPLFGQIKISVSEAQLGNKGQCLSSTGSWETDALMRTGPSFGWNGPQLMGPISCSKGAWILDLSGEQDGTQVRLRLTVPPTQSGTLDIAVVTPPAALSFALLEKGFEADASGALIWTQPLEGFGGLQ